MNILDEIDYGDIADTAVEMAEFVYEARPDAIMLSLRSGHPPWETRYGSLEE